MTEEEIIDSAMEEYSDHERSYKDILGVAEDSLKEIMLGEDALKKHGSYGFTKLSVITHLMKAARHITTHLINKEIGKDDGEYHLNNALTRVAMAIFMEKKGK
jgi:hypothetical protein